MNEEKAKTYFQVLRRAVDEMEKRTFTKFAEDIKTASMFQHPLFVS